MKRISGILAAAMTPFQSTGELDLPRIPSLVEHLLKEGVEGFFVCGSTGEFPSLTLIERKKVAAEYVKGVGGRVPVIIHVGSDSLHDACDLAQHATTIGADGIAAVPPHYFPVTELDGVVRCIETIAAAAPQLPFYYYHIPGITGVQLDVATLLKQASSVPNLAGAKYSAANLHEFLAANLVDPQRFTLFFGTDEMFLAALAMGANGFVGSTYNFLNRHYLQLRQLFQSGKQSEALALQQRLVEFVRIVSQFRGLAGLKAMMEVAGAPCGPVRSPLMPLKTNEIAQLQSQIARFELM